MRRDCMARNVGLLLLAAAAAPAAIAAGVGCTAEDDCLNQPTAYRCLPTSDGSGSPCTLDYSFNETGHCACQPQACVLLTTAPKTTLKQLLVIGDSISDGYLTSLTTALAASWEVTHAPSFSSSNNNDNANWHARCNIGWLGTNASRWDAVSVNAGLHDMAQPDNEHLNASNYQSRLQVALGQLVATLPARTKIIWARTTPVPTNPAPNCVLLPGRLEVNVEAYNVVADQVVATFGSRVGTCDLHKVITDHCGVGYATCDIAQCGGPHFTAAGFSMLGAAVAACVQA